MNKKAGVSLVELVIVLAVIAILVMIMIGGIDPIKMVAKANDSRRKKDLAKISLSFEEYYNDKACYPDQTIINQLNTVSNCGSNIFKPWLSKWPCDPERRQPYIVMTQASECPSWYKVYTNLANKNDNDIPEGWYSPEYNYLFGNGLLTPDDANFGSSSTNVTWHERQLASYCGQGCFRGSGPTNCGHTSFCEGIGTCFTDPDCHSECAVSSCP